MKQTNEPAVVKHDGPLIEKLDTICDEIFERWDKDQRSGKLLSALSGRLTSYRPDVDDIRGALDRCDRALLFPTTITPAIRDVLSMMLWHTGPIAHAFRADGQEIPTRAEDEQSYVMFWALKLAIQHGENWRAVGTEELKQSKERFDAKATGHPVDQS